MKSSPAALFALVFFACGGSEELSRPAPIRYTIDDFHIAAVPVEAKGSVINTKQDYDVALMEKAKTQSDLDDTKTKLEVAKNDAKSAELHQKSAATEKSAAEKTANMTAQNEASGHVHAAEMEKAAADARVEYLKARQTWLERLLRSRDFDVAAKEAKWQLEKARVAQANNIRPPGFDEAQFERQYQERTDQAGKALTDAERERGKVADKERDWNAKQQQWDAQHGGANMNMSPQAPPSYPNP